MLVLVLGVAVFALVHFFKALAPDVRADAISRFGEKPYKGLIGILLLAAVACMVKGYSAATVIPVYTPPYWAGWATLPLMAIALLLFISARAPTNIKRFIRHPQLTSILIWAGAHLLSNGDVADLVLFGGLGSWAIAEIALINRREGEWVKPTPVSVVKDIVTVAIAIALFFLVAWLHARALGVRLF